MNAPLTSEKRVEPRTYGDLMRMTTPSHHQTCCVCHRWPSQIGRVTLDRDDAGDMFRLGTRAHICRECCEKKKDMLLGSVVKAERSARKYVREALERGEDPALNLRFYSHLSGATQEWIASEIERLRAEAT